MKRWASIRLAQTGANGEGIQEDEAHTLDGTGQLGVFECGSDRSSAASEDSTSASGEQDTPSSSNARSTPTEDEFSPDTGRESRAMKTFDLWPGTGENEYGERTVAAKETDVSQALDTRGQAPNRGYGTLISSAEASPAKISPSPADGQDSRESAPPSSSSSQGSQMTFSGAEDGSSLRTYPDFFPPTVDEISQSYSRRWPSSGFTTSPGECWTADTSECPSDGAVSSSLPDVLEADVHPRFYLSRKAAAGILRRAEKRGRVLPGALQTALSRLAASPDQSDGMGRRRTSSPPLIEDEADQTTTTPKGIDLSQPPSSDQLGDSTSSNPSSVRRLTPTESLLPSQREVPLERESATPAGDERTTKTSLSPAEETQTVRRLTPTECERLQGFPDGWTVVSFSRTAGANSDSLEAKETKREA